MENCGSFEKQMYQEAARMWAVVWPPGFELFCHAAYGDLLKARLVIVILSSWVSVVEHWKTKLYADARA